MEEAKTIKDETKFTKKELLFCKYYLETFNASEAARRAGYSKKTAPHIGYENLKKEHLKVYIDRKKQEILSECGVNEVSVIRELAKIAYFDPRSLFTEDGALKPVKEWGDAVAGCIAAIENEEMPGGDLPTGTLKKVKFINKEGALRQLLQYLGVSTDKLSVRAKLTDSDPDSPSNGGKTFEVTMEL